MKSKKLFKVSDATVSYLNFADKKYLPSPMPNLELICEMNDNLYSNEPNLEADFPKLNVFSSDQTPKDFMEVLPLGGFTFRDKALELFEAMNLPPYEILPFEYIYKKVWYKTNYIVIKKRLEDYIDYTLSTFVYVNQKEDIYQPILVKDSMDYLDKTKKYRQYFKCSKLVLTKEGGEIDYFYSYFFLRFICSEKFKKTYKNLKLRNLHFNDISLSLDFGTFEILQ